MRAAFFEGFRAMTVRDAPVPEPGPGEVLVRVRYCGICGSDLSLYRTGVLAGPDVILGHEVSAVVDHDPSGAWQPGARVTVYPNRGCGRCLWCREGKFRYCLDPPDHHGGGYAEFAAVPARNLIPLPEDLDDPTAAAAEPFGVALRGVELAGPRAGDFAYVSGLGSIGLFTVAGLVAEGCRVMGADPREDRRRLGLEAGCEAVIDPTKQDTVSATLELDPHGPRLAFECAGVPESLQQVFDTCGYEGVVGILGIPMAPVFLLRMTLRELRAFSIQGPSMDSMRRAIELLRDRPEGRVAITGTVPLEAVPQAFEDLVEGRGGVKVLVEPGS
jgi:threonine dehydrogenase-like Zn-dependent dehydrogenase